MDMFRITEGMRFIKWLMTTSPCLQEVDSNDFNRPSGLAVDFQRNVYVADRFNNRPKIDPMGTVSTFFDTDLEGPTDLLWIERQTVCRRWNTDFRDDDIPPRSYGSNPGFSQPVGLAIDRLGNLCVGHIGTHKIYKINKIDQMKVSVLAGSSNGFRNGSGSEALFDTPYDLFVDEDFNVYGVRFRKSSNP